MSFNEGKFPTQLKSANVIPVFKKGDKLEVNNYRPISLISNISKVIEKLIHRRLNSFLEQIIFFIHLSLVSEIDILLHMSLLKSLIKL